MQVVVVETGGRPVVVGGDVAVWFGELDEPRTDGQLRVRALEPELVWLAHEHEPWRPRTMSGAPQCIWPAVTYKWVVLTNTTIGTADRWQSGRATKSSLRPTGSPGSVRRGGRGSSRRTPSRTDLRVTPCWRRGFMETSGRHRWQLVANAKREKTPKTSQNRCRRLPIGAHGKEGVGGSSPPEGLRKMPVNRHFAVVSLLNARTHSGHICGTRVPPRRLATPIATNLITKSLLESGNSPANGKLQSFSCLNRRERDLFSAGRRSASPRSRRFPAHRRQLRSECGLGKPVAMDERGKRLR
jgi:hypothetical protein